MAEQPLKREHIAGALVALQAERDALVDRLPELQIAQARLHLANKPGAPLASTARQRIGEIDDLIFGLKKLDAEIEHPELGVSIGTAQQRDDAIHHRLLVLDAEERAAYSRTGAFGAVLKSGEPDPVASKRAELDAEVRALQAERSGVRQRIAAASARRIELEALHPSLVPHEGAPA